MIMNAAASVGRLPISYASNKSLFNATVNQQIGTRVLQFNIFTLGLIYF